MEKVRLLIVDDNPYIHEQISTLVSVDPEIEVVGSAYNGGEAVHMAAELKPDLITMDVNMPLMNGIDAITQIMVRHAVPIVVISFEDTPELSFEAISRGAVEVISKKSLYKIDKKEFADSLKLFSKVKVVSHIRPSISKVITPIKSKSPGKERIIAIAISTGGPQVLEELLSMFPKDYPYAILVVQHIADDFITGMVNWLDGKVLLSVKTAQNCETIAPGTVYFAPSKHHLMLSIKGKIKVEAGEKSDLYVPSGNKLLCSVANIYGSEGIGVVLTGMGNDGAEGIVQIKGHGGVTIAQDETTSVIYGMPQRALETGCVDFVMTTKEIGSFLINLVAGTE